MADSTPSYAANIAVRAFLTDFTSEHLREVFGRHLSDGEYKRGEKQKRGIRKYGKGEWECIKKKFCSRCAYCGEKEKSDQQLTVEHLKMFNSSQCGLQHPGNVVPSCSSCNSSRKGPDKTWEEQIKPKSGNKYENRIDTIKAHINSYDNYSNYNLSTSSDTCPSLEKIAQELHEEVQCAIKSAVKKATKLLK